jgi:hypothetical protein
MAKKSKKSSFTAPNNAKNAGVLKRAPGAGPKNQQNYKKGGRGR